MLYVLNPFTVLFHTGCQIIGTQYTIQVGVLNHTKARVGFFTRISASRFSPQIYPEINT